MKKFLLILLTVILVMMFSSCTKVTEGPDVSGIWTVNAIIAGKVIEFQMEVVQNGLLFEATAVYPISAGAVSTTDMVRFAITLDGITHYCYGNINGDYMDGFTRKGEAGDVNGNWSAAR